MFTFNLYLAASSKVSGTQGQKKTKPFRIFIIVLLIELPFLCIFKRNNGSNQGWGS